MMNLSIKIILSLMILVYMLSNVNIHASSMKDCKGKKADIVEHTKIIYCNKHKNSLQENVARNYDDNGNLKEEIPYKNNMIYGIGRVYYKNGNI